MLGMGILNERGFPSWPWPGDCVVPLHRGLHLRRAIFGIDPADLCYRVEGVNQGDRTATLRPVLDLLNLSCVALTEALPLEVSFDMLAFAYRPTLQPWTRSRERTAYDALLEEDWV